MMFVHPLEDNFLESFGQTTMNNMIFYGNARSRARIVNMYMRRVVVVDEHQDDDTVEAANLRHGINSPGRRFRAR